MAWTKLIRQNSQSEEPLVIISQGRFSFNTILTRIAEIEKKRFVTYYVDDENYKIGFEFTSNKKENESYAVVKKERGGCHSKNQELFTKKWIQNISKNKKENKFKAEREGNLYVITLMPSFEESIPLENYKLIPSEAQGIYRYLDGDKIVYIGKGNIRQRLNEVPRKDWKFDTIEYSIIYDSDLQFKWESFWIERYKKHNNNKLPSYNLISGKKE